MKFETAEHKSASKIIVASIFFLLKYCSSKCERLIYIPHYALLVRWLVADNKTHGYQNKNLVVVSP